MLGKTMVDEPRQSHSTMVGQNRATSMVARFSKLVVLQRMMLFLIFEKTCTINLLENSSYLNLALQQPRPVVIETAQAPQYGPATFQIILAAPFPTRKIVGKFLPLSPASLTMPSGCSGC